MLLSLDRALPGHRSAAGVRPGTLGAHSQGETFDELQANLQEVIAMLLEDVVASFSRGWMGFSAAS